MRTGSGVSRVAAVITALCLTGIFLCEQVFHVRSIPVVLADLPAPTQIVSASDSYWLPVLKGISLDRSDPLNVDFILDTGDEQDVSEQDAYRLINYFLAGLTVPGEDLWVNLSPDEQDRVLAQGLETTELGRDLLAQDYLLKQLASSLTHPDTPIGEAYWRVENGKSTIENRLGKIWIVPDTAEVYESGTTVVITEASLKLQCEDAAQQVLLPEITRDVNEGRNFARLRQIYHSLILARWFKTKLRDSLYAAYIDAHKLKGIDTCDPALKEKIFALYVESFKKGVYDTIRSDSASDRFSILDSQFSKNRRRRFFSGGAYLGDIGISGSAVVYDDSRQALDAHARGKLQVISSALSPFSLQPVPGIGGTGTRGDPLVGFLLAHGCDVVEYMTDPGRLYAMTRFIQTQPTGMPLKKVLRECAANQLFAGMTAAKREQLVSLLMQYTPMLPSQALRDAGPIVSSKVSGRLRDGAPGAGAMKVETSLFSNAPPPPSPASFSEFTREVRDGYGRYAARELLHAANALWPLADPGRAQSYVLAAHEKLVAFAALQACVPDAGRLFLDFEVDFQELSKSEMRVVSKMSNWIAGQDEGYKSSLMRRVAYYLTALYPQPAPDKFDRVLDNAFHSERLKGAALLADCARAGRAMAVVGATVSHCMYPLFLPDEDVPQMYFVTFDRMTALLLRSMAELAGRSGRFHVVDAADDGLFGIGQGVAGHVQVPAFDGAANDDMILECIDHLAAPYAGVTVVSRFSPGDSQFIPVFSRRLMTLGVSVSKDVLQEQATNAWQQSMGSWKFTRSSWLVFRGRRVDDAWMNAFEQARVSVRPLEQEESDADPVFAVSGLRSARLTLSATVEPHERLRLAQTLAQIVGRPRDVWTPESYIAARSSEVPDNAVHLPAQPDLNVAGESVGDMFVYGSGFSGDDLEEVVSETGIRPVEEWSKQACAVFITAQEAEQAWDMAARVFPERGIGGPVVLARGEFTDSHLKGLGFVVFARRSGDGTYFDSVFQERGALIEDSMNEHLHRESRDVRRMLVQVPDYDIDAANARFDPVKIRRSLLERNDITRYCFQLGRSIRDAIDRGVVPSPSAVGIIVDEHDSGRVTFHNVRGSADLRAMTADEAFEAIYKALVGIASNIAGYKCSDLYRTAGIADPVARFFEGVFHDGNALLLQGLYESAGRDAIDRLTPDPRIETPLRQRTYVPLVALVNTLIKDDGTRPASATARTSTHTRTDWFDPAYAAFVSFGRKSHPLHEHLREAMKLGLEPETLRAEFEELRRDYDELKLLYERGELSWVQMEKSTLRMQCPYFDMIDFYSSRNDLETAFILLADWQSVFAVTDPRAAMYATYIYTRILKRHAGREDEFARVIENRHDPVSVAVSAFLALKDERYDEVRLRAAALKKMAGTKQELVEVATMIAVAADCLDRDASADQMGLWHGSWQIDEVRYGYMLEGIEEYLRDHILAVQLRRMRDEGMALARERVGAWLNVADPIALWSDPAAIRSLKEALPVLEEIGRARHGSYQRNVPPALGAALVRGEALCRLMRYDAKRDRDWFKAHLMQAGAVKVLVNDEYALLHDALGTAAKREFMLLLNLILEYGSAAGEDTDDERNGKAVYDMLTNLGFDKHLCRLGRIVAAGRSTLASMLDAGACEMPSAVLDMIEHAESGKLPADEVEAMFLVQAVLDALGRGKQIRAQNVARPVFNSGRGSGDDLKRIAEGTASSGINGGIDMAGLRVKSSGSALTVDPGTQAPVIDGLRATVLSIRPMDEDVRNDIPVLR